MKLIYTLILLLFSSSIFAEFLDVDSSISDLLVYGFEVKQIDTINVKRYVYHLQSYEDVAICYYYDGREQCMIDTQDKSLIEDLKNK
jgi:hypothetical protein